MKKRKQNERKRSIRDNEPSGVHGLPERGFCDSEPKFGPLLFLLVSRGGLRGGGRDGVRSRAGCRRKSFICSGISLGRQQRKNTTARIRPSRRRRFSLFHDFRQPRANVLDHLHHQQQIRVFIGFASINRYVPSLMGPLWSDFWVFFYSN